MKENKKGILGQTIYRPKQMDFRSRLMEDPSDEKEMPTTRTHHHEDFLDQYPN